jgi:hypothetical protein
MKIQSLLSMLALPMALSAQSFECSYVRNDTTFTLVKHNEGDDFQNVVLIGSFDMGEIGRSVYLFFKRNNNVVALPIDRFPALMMEYPETNHQRKQGDFVLTERWRNLPTK